MNKVFMENFIIGKQKFKYKRDQRRQKFKQ